jgi:hypothetical protein
VPPGLGPSLGTLLTAVFVLTACGGPVSESPREGVPVPAPVWVPPGADLAVALAPQAVRGSAAARGLLAEAARLLKAPLPELAAELQRAGSLEEDATLLVTSMGWSADGSFWTATSPLSPAGEGGESETLSASGPEPVAALVHLLPERLPPRTLAGLPDHLRRLVLSLRRVGLALRAGENLALSGRGEAPGESEAASLASILRGLAESSGAGARARGDMDLAEALAALQIESRGPIVILEARLRGEQARVLLRASEAPP